MKLFNKAILILWVTVLILLLDYSISKPQHYQKIPNKDPTEKFLKKPVPSNWNIKIARYFRDVAGLGYVPDESAKEQLDEIKKGPKKDKSKVSSLFKKFFELEKWEHITTITGDNKFRNYSFTIIRSLKYGKFIFTFSGTKGLEQLKDEYYNNSGLHYGLSKFIIIMKYFYELYMSIHIKLKEFFIKYDDTDIKQYIFVGHSLGGAIASVALYDFMNLKLINKTENSPVLITYGQPRTGNYAFANELMKNVPIVYRHVNDYDLVFAIPACQTKNGKCINEFMKDKLKPQYYHYEKSYLKFKGTNDYVEGLFYPYHIGGLILNKGDTKSIDCTHQSEVDEKDQCRGIPSLEFDFHKYYYGYKVSDMWKPDIFEYDLVKSEDVLKTKADDNNIIRKKLIWEDYSKSWNISSIASWIGKGLINKTLKAFNYYHGK